MDPPQKLNPGILKIFLDDSQDGAVIISFGSMAKSSNFDKKTLEKFLQVFRQLSNLNFVWKFDGEIHEIPTNLMISNWLPSLADVLAHQNVKLLITHGGLLSAYEAIDREIPTIIFPFAFDHSTNAKLMTKTGIAVEMDLNEFTSEEFEMQIVEMMKSEKRENVKNLKNLMAENSPKEILISSVEFLIHNKNDSRIFTKVREENFSFIFFTIFLVLFMKFMIKIFNKN